MRNSRMVTRHEIQNLLQRPLAGVSVHIAAGVAALPVHGIHLIAGLLQDPDGAPEQVGILQRL